MSKELFNNWDDENESQAYIIEVHENNNPQNMLEEEMIEIFDKGLSHYNGINSDFFIKDGLITVVANGLAYEKGSIFSCIEDDEMRKKASNVFLKTWWPMFSREDIGTDSPVSSFSKDLTRYELNIDSMGSVSLAVRHLLKDIQTASGNEDVVEFYAKAYKHLRLLVCGIPGSGKTTFINRVISHPNSPNIRKAIIQDVLEISPKPTDYSAVAEYDAQGIYIKSSMRQTPKVLIVGEIRTPDIVLQTLSSMLLTEGGLTTFHASNAVDAIKRIKIFLIMASGVTEQAAENIISQSLDHVIVLSDKKVIETKEVKDVLKKIKEQG